MVTQGRVITTDFNLVKVAPVVDDTDGYHCAGVDSEGNLYVWGVLKHFLPNEKQVLNQCWDERVSDEEFMKITELMIQELD